MKVRAPAVTHSGKLRNQNDDFYLCDPELGLYLVCDGITHAFGTYCAEAAGKGIQSHLKNNRGVLSKHEISSTSQSRQEVGRLLREAVERVSSGLYEEAQKDPKKKGMLSTIAAVLVSKGFAFIAHLGDSRVYSIRGGAFHPLTRDHTYLNALLQSGKSLEEARKTIYAGNLSAAVGHQPIANVSVCIRELATGERLMICTDGVSDTFDAGTFKTPWAEVATDTLPATLRDHSLACGGRDNLTAVVLEFELTEEKMSANIRQKLGTIRGIRLFQHLGDEALIHFLSLADTRQYKAGDALIRKGVLINEMFIVIEGDISVDLGEGPIDATESKGAVLGEMSLFDGTLPNATVTALKPTTVIVISRDALFSALRDDYSFAARLELGILQAVIRRLRERTEPDEELRKMTNYSVVSIFP